jgi:hypothetical protein
MKVRHMMVLVMTASASARWHRTTVRAASTDRSALLFDHRTNYDSNDSLCDPWSSPSENSSHFVFFRRLEFSSQFQNFIYEHRK